MAPRKKILILSFVLIAAVGAAIYYLITSSTAADVPFSLLPVSPETTLLTSPLKPDGSVDFLAAINQKLSEGVTPESNALVALLPVVGTSEALGDQHDAIRQALGSREFAPLFVEWDHRPLAVGDTPDKALKRFGEKHYLLSSAPWTPADDPEFDAWLKLNQPAFDIVAQAVTLPHFWFPLISKDGNLSSAAAPSLAVPLYRIGDALRIRVMRSLGAADATAAWADLLTTHRLNRLRIANADMVLYSIGVRDERLTLDLDIAILNSPNASAQLITHMLDYLNHADPISTFSQFAHRVEIYNFPDVIQSMAKRGKTSWESQSPEERRRLQSSLGLAHLFSPDWSRIAHFGNDFLEKYYASPTAANAAEWRTWRNSIRAQVDALRAAYEKDLRPDDPDSIGGITKAFLLPRPGESRDTYSDRLARHIVDMIFPVTIETDVLNTQKKVEILRLACALTLYRLDTGTYPPTPEPAAAKYLPAMPTGFWNRPIAYSRSADGFKLEAWPPAASTPEEAAKDGMLTIEIKRP